MYTNLFDATRMENIILWKKFLDGDKKALSQIFRIYFDDLFSYGMKISNSTEIVEDSMQDMFLKLWKNRENLSEISNIKLYLFKALRHRIFDNLNWKSRFISTKIPNEELFDFEFSHEDFLINEQLDIEKREKLINILNQLSKSQKEAIYLRYFKNYDIKLIAKIMNINLQSARNALYRGIAACKELIN